MSPLASAPSGGGTAGPNVVALAAAAAAAAALSAAATYAAMTYLQGGSSHHPHQQQLRRPRLAPADSGHPPPPATTLTPRSAACAAPVTPEPACSHASCVTSSSSSVFSPVNAAKRSDPFDTRPRSDYMSWDDYFMALAFLSAERSKDPNKQVGAVIVSPTNIILGIGYNGFPRGCCDAALPWAKRAASGSILDTKYPYVVHAEANALLNKNQAQVAGARIYVTLFPCNECAKLLIQAGIQEVVFNEAKLEPTGRRPGTMEQAAAADCREDEQQQQQRGASSSSSSGGGHAPPKHQQQQQVGRQQQTASGGRSSSSGGGSSRGGPGAAGASKGGGVLDDSYAASQRLLNLAGVSVRQHTLRHTVCLGPK